MNIKTVAPYNHQSVQAEHGIKSLSNILNKHLTLIKEYYELLNKRLKYWHTLLTNFKSRRLAMISKDRAHSSTIAEI